MSARDDILAAVRAALVDAEPAPTEPVVPPAGQSAPDLITHFIERVIDYRASAKTCTDAGLLRAVRAAIPTGASVIVPPGLGLDIRGAVIDEQSLTAANLDAIDVVITRARVGIAETGTIVLDHDETQGRRAITLVPDMHICLVARSQIVADVPEAIAILDPARPQTWISGPSATSDIELDRVEGVHGPRTLYVLVHGD
jgi:L-lactate utilization protein LutC